MLWCPARCLALGFQFLQLRRQHLVGDPGPVLLQFPVPHHARPQPPQDRHLPRPPDPVHGELDGIVIQLAKDAGFAACYDVGGNDRFELMEQFALFWINLAMMQGLGREIEFKLLTR